MTIAKTLVATGNVAPKQSILFGVNVATTFDLAPLPPPTVSLVVDIHDSLVADGSGTLVAKIIIPAGQEGSKQIIFPAGVRCGKGLSAVITGAQHNPVVSIDFS